jgi:hypothetical protein
MPPCILRNRYSVKIKRDQFAPTASSLKERLSPTAVPLNCIYKNNTAKTVYHFCNAAVLSYLQINLGRIETRGNRYEFCDYDTLLEKLYSRQLEG